LINARTGNNVGLCDSGASTCEPQKKKSNQILVIATTVPIAVATLLFVAALLILHRMRNRQGNLSLRIFFYIITCISSSKPLNFCS
jgi:hypothetical protein